MTHIYTLTGTIPTFSEKPILKGATRISGMEPQKHYHYERIRLGDKIKYAILGAAVGAGIMYYTGTNPDTAIDSLKETYKDARPRIEELLKK